MNEINRIILEKPNIRLMLEDSSDSFTFEFKSRELSHISFSFKDEKVFSSFCLFRNMIKELIYLGYLNDEIIKSSTNDDWMMIDYVMGRLTLDFPHKYSSVVISKELENPITLVPFDRLFSDLEFCEGEVITHKIDDYSDAYDLKLVLE